MSKKKKPTGNYRIGYCRPPEDHKFKPGDRGNPNGRPPKTANDNINFLGVFRRAALRTRSVTVDGRKQKLSNLELAAEQLFQNFANGKSKNYKDLIALLKIILPQQAHEEENGADYGAELRAKLERMARGAREERERRAAYDEESANQTKKNEK